MVYSFKKPFINVSKVNSLLQSSTFALKIDSLDFQEGVFTLKCNTSLSMDEETELYRILGEDTSKDSEGSLIVRSKQAPTGWTYNARAFEFTTSSLNSVICLRQDGTDPGFMSVKLYNSAGQEITDQLVADTDCVKTVVDWEPTFDYEILSGRMYLKDTQLNEDVRMWVVGVPDIPKELGGSKEMVCGINLNYIDAFQPLTTDGRVSKHMSYDSVYHTNKLRFILTHNAGKKLDLMFILELFKY